MTPSYIIPIVTEFNVSHHYFKGTIMEKQLDTSASVSALNVADLRDLLDSEIILIGGGELIAEFK